jgi:ketosteroid isomerase-like protein
MTTIKSAVEDLLGDRELSPDEVADRHFGPGFEQRVNGTRLDRAAFLERMAELRELVAHATVTVLDEVSEGDRYAERHVISLTQRDGTRVAQEVFVFAQRDADGRFVRIDETSVPLRDEP